MRKKLGVVTIGQSPRSDVGPVLEEHLGKDIEVLQIGVLDGLSQEDITRMLAPGPKDYVLTSRLRTGDSAIMARDKIWPILQERIFTLEDAGCVKILVLCTGVFEGLRTRKAHLIEPDQIITPVVSTMVRGLKFGVIVPLKEQEKSLAFKWERYGLQPSFAAASPYESGPEAFQLAAEKLKSSEVEIILLDCMGYTEEHRKRVSQHSSLPVILSNSLMAKILSEMI